MLRARASIGLKIAAAGVAIALLTVVAVYLGSGRLFHKTSTIAPRGYAKKVATGGAIESKYLATGSFKTRSLYVAAPGLLETFSIFYPAELTTSDRKYPVVVFANASGVVASQYEAVLRRLASWGFVAIANDLPGSSLGTPTNQTLDYLLERAKDPDSIFYRKIDEERIGAVGHSLGGVGVVSAVVDDGAKRYRCVVALSPAAIRLTDPDTGRETYLGFDKVTVPIAIFFGTERDVMSPEDAAALYETIPAEKIMAFRVGANHAQTLYFEDGYVTAWLRWKLQGDETAAKAFVGDRPEIFENPLYREQEENFVRTTVSLTHHRPALFDLALFRQSKRSEVCKRQRER